MQRIITFKIARKNVTRIIIGSIKIKAIGAINNTNGNNAMELICSAMHYNFQCYCA